MSWPRGIGALVAFAALVVLAVPVGADAQGNCVNVRTGEPVGCSEPGAVTQKIYDESTLRDNCVHVRTGEPLDCAEAGAVTEEVYEESPLRDEAPAEESSPSESSDSGSDVPWAEITAVVGGTAAIVLAAGATITWRRRQRQRVLEESAAELNKPPAVPPPPPPSPTVGATTAPGPVGGEVEQERTGTPDLIAAAERARTAHHRPTPAAGWYPDPGQPQTQRYWDGSDWTEQRAPLAESTDGLRFGTILVLLGAVMVLVGLFLPWMEASALAPIRENTLIQGGDGWLALAAAIAAAGSAWASRAKTGRNWTGVILGLLIVGFAIYLGTGERLELVNAAGERVAEGTPGLGLFVVGAGGLLIALGGWREDD